MVISFATENSHLQDRVSRFDAIAMPQISGLNSPAIDASAVGASQIEQPTHRRIGLDHEMHAGEIGVLFRESKMCKLRATYKEVIVPVKRKCLSGMRALNDAEENLHGAVRFIPTASNTMEL